MRANAVLLVGVGALLAACSSSNDSKQDLNTAPVDYKTQVVATVLKLGLGPENVGEPMISEPARVSEGPYTLCVRYNANGKTETRIGYFYTGQLTQLVTATGDQCSRAAYQPFPELQRK